jgi:hypothetical protein
MPGLDPGIHRAAAPWIAGSSPAMTTGNGGWRLDLRQTLGVSLP